MNQDRSQPTTASTDELVVLDLDDSTDIRGASFSVLEKHLDLIGPVKDLHIAAIVPGATRGNHYHTRRSELIALVYRGPWSLHWDSGDGTPKRHRRFSGSGGVIVVPPRNWSHAVRNDGGADIWMVAASDEPYDRQDPSQDNRDAFRRIVDDADR